MRGFSQAYTWNGALKEYMSSLLCWTLAQSAIKMHNGVQDRVMSTERDSKVISVAALLHRK
jgi:hypothetical protein